MQFGDYLDDIARAAGFLSRLPMPAHHFRDHDGTLSRAAAMFPVAGLLIGLGPGLLVWLLGALGANAALTALIALMVLIGLTGALHEDGLADSADAFGARGGREQMLAIMKDSRIGTYGVLALMISFSLRAVALTIITAATGGLNALLLLLAVAAISRTAMVWHWSALALARTDGVAAAVGAPESRPGQADASDRQWPVPAVRRPGLRPDHSRDRSWPCGCRSLALDRHGARTAWRPHRRHHWRNPADHRDCGSCDPCPFALNARYKRHLTPKAWLNTR
jgi:adenosylcobinamide-GDP ribazoletransferase